MGHSTTTFPSSTFPDSSAFWTGTRAHLEGVWEKAWVFRMTCRSCFETHMVEPVPQGDPHYQTLIHSSVPAPRSRWTAHDADRNTQHETHSSSEKGLSYKKKSACMWELSKFRGFFLSKTVIISFKPDTSLRLICLPIAVSLSSYQSFSLFLLLCMSFR